MEDGIHVIVGNENVETVRVHHIESKAGAEPESKPLIQPALSPEKPNLPPVAHGVEDHVAYVSLYSYGDTLVHGVVYVSNSAESITQKAGARGIGDNLIKTRKIEDTDIRELDPRFTLQLTQRMQGYDQMPTQSGDVYVHEIPNMRPKILRQVTSIIDSL